MPERRRIRVTGTVQGVGFRPFVYRMAVRLGLAGSVCNLGDAGVEIDVEGEAEGIESLLEALRTQAPSLAVIDRISAEPQPTVGHSEFMIAPSTEGAAARGTLPPDTAICAECERDILNDTRYRGYWATSCTDCGPRFTVIEGLPYDRPQTSMDEFPLCPDCKAEYTDPLDRRYHAQTIACAACGPRLTFDGARGDAIVRAADALRRGGIVAVKGIGGTHLVCDARSDETVRTLRERVGRSQQPFALMASEDTVADFAAPTADEWALLQSPERPIVLVRTKEPTAVSSAVAPGLDSVGLMLPYSGLHVLLLAAYPGPLVMTSANLPGRPMAIDNAEIEKKLAGMADHFLLHDRRIVARCDDSVVRRSGGETVLIRRSRGFVPRPISIELGDEAILALGPETGVTVTIYGGGAVTLSQHIGSVDNVETFEFLQDAIAHLGRILGSKPAALVACDLHPDFLTTHHAHRLGKTLGARVVPVQHHAAHAVALAGEHGIDRFVAVVLDGFGYGVDRTAWGGEVFELSGRTIDRVGTLSPVRMPGGDAAARFPRRMLASYLLSGGVPARRVREVLLQCGAETDEANVVLRQLDRDVNCPRTSSAGRFLDAAAAWLDVCQARTYEGEPAMRLEAAARSGTPLQFAPATIRRTSHGGRTLDVAGALAELIFTVDPKSAMRDRAATAQRILADGVARMAIETADEADIDTVGFSGGVAYNDAIASRIRAVVEAAGKTYITNCAVPCGDGGVSFGQAVCAGLGWTFGVDRCVEEPGT